MKTVWTLNTLTGVVDQIPEHLFNHPTFAEYHVEVAPGTKSYAPEKYEPKTADEYRAIHAEKKAENKK